ncbi:MAG: hypothetical protein C0518_02470 [Opitutus sp.]|nr:hypothetical protein [Opitutus sp.]
MNARAPFFIFRAPPFPALLVLALAGAFVFGAATTAHARIGESGADLRKRFGRPESQPSKDVLVWLIEEPSGALLYTVTLDDRGISIAEGLKPFRQAALSEQSARNFIKDQLSMLADPRTARAVKPGESYVFGGETLSCGEHEQVIVDDANNLLVIWATRPMPSVMAATHEMMQRTRR